MVKAFLRDASEDPAGQVEDDLSIVYKKIRGIQRGIHDSVKDSGMTLISSNIGGTQFVYRFDEGVSPAGILEITERALELVEAVSTMAELRAS